jgi:molybdopterin-guanine dinucleotide biosynthesis protein A
MMINNSQDEPGYLDLQDSMDNLAGSVQQDKPINQGALSNMVTALSYLIGQYAAACPSPMPSANQNVLSKFTQALQEFESAQYSSNPKEDVSAARNTYYGALNAFQQAGPPPGSIPPPPSMR